MSEYDLLINQIDVYVLNGKKHLNNSGFHCHYDCAYLAWHETWEKTYKCDFQATSFLPSDEFTRQDEILAIFFRGECAALCFFSHVNMVDESAKSDSYFKNWPEIAVSGLCEQGSEVIICSQFTVIEKFRKEELMMDASWKNILMGLLIKYFVESQKHAMTGTMRVNKAMDRLTYKFGATPLIEKMEYPAGKEMTLVDLVAFFQSNVQIAYEDYCHSALLDELWKKRNLLQKLNSLKKAA
jgi:hypothetical protein